MSPYRHPKAAEARAILHSVKASLCPHGVRWRDCKDHESEPGEGGETATEQAPGGAS